MVFVIIVIDYDYSIVVLFKTNMDVYNYVNVWFVCVHILLVLMLQQSWRLA